MAAKKVEQAPSSGMGNPTAVAIRDFHAMLVLWQWARSFFQGERFSVLQQKLNHTYLEGIDPETGHTRFFMALTGDLFNFNRTDPATFAQYDTNIVGYWREITAKRNEASGTVLNLKYFQYLSLLMTELYLDWYFNHRDELLKELNGRIEAYNAEHPKTKLTPVLEEDLNKVSFWEATGAGKTLLLHVNIKQYLHYAPNKPDRVILLTPNEGLSRQHLGELALSGIQADLMRENDLFHQGAAMVSVVDSGKLISEESTKKKGEKSFMAESFEGKNLVLVDEGHHGASAEDGEHRRTRNLLCRDGFSFEYSATFGQAVADKKATALRNLYARNILFDYSYKFFYEDGYGKDAFILNMPDDRDHDQVFKYLCANLLAYCQQHDLFARKREVMESFGIAKPLCVFVGTTVNTEDSDVGEIVRFFAEVLSKRQETEKIFNALLHGEPIVTVNGRNVLANFFNPLAGKTGAEIYSDLLERVFNAPVSARLKVRLVKKSGEVLLSVGTGYPFGIVNIGSPDTFVKTMANEPLLDVEPADEIGESHFAEIDKPGSPISVLVGSRKFTEGWSSWRVSAMGLLNMGVNEGTQIIQLFGRGVRLRGRGFTLKRSTLEERQAAAPGLFLDKLETLMIFGIRANYMAKFREYLEAEGVQSKDDVLTLNFKIRRNNYPHSLLMPRLKDGFGLNQKYGFKTRPVTLFDVPSGMEKKIKKILVRYDDFAYLQMVQTDSKIADAVQVDAQGVKLDSKAFAYFDWDEIYRQLMSEKAQRGYWNLSLDKAKLIDFAKGSNNWYVLVARPADVQFTSFANLGKIKRLFTALIVGYMQKFYETFQSIYEEDHMEMRPIDDDKLPEEFLFEIERTDDGHLWYQRLQELKRLVDKEDIPVKEINQWSPNEAFVAISFPSHLYTPLFYQRKDAQLPFTMKPLSLGAESEMRFVKDLECFYNSPKNAIFFRDCDMYLMRNASSKLKGIGFAQAGNFYPDFLLWLVDKQTRRQYLTFIDPKGLRNIPFDSPKLNFSQEIKTLEKNINRDCDNQIVLNSVILSDTKLEVLESLFGHSKEEYENKHVFFQEEGADVYLPKLFAMMGISPN